MERYRWPWPKQTVDRIALCIFTVGGLFLIWYETCLVLPTYHSSISLAVILHCFIMIFLALEIYGNMLMLVTTNISSRASLFSQSYGSVYCSICNQSCPARSHHCKLCGFCILKRDHHCWFAGYCIGYHNHRYYFIMLVYITIVAIYCNIFNFHFVMDLRRTMDLSAIASFVAPHVGWLLGYYDTFTFFITTLTTIGLLLLVLFLWLLQIQCLQIFHGQTRYEKKKNRESYNLGWKRNLQEVLGDRWILVWLLPWVTSKLPGDGYFQSKDKQSKFL